MRRFFSVLFSLMLFALVIYNIRQVYALRHEVADLRAQVAALKAGKGGDSGDSVVSKAMKHLDMAKQYALRGDFKHANKELDYSAEVIRRAGRDATGPYADSLARAERTLDKTRKTVEGLWQKGGKSSGKGKGG